MISGGIAFTVRTAIVEAAGCGPTTTRVLATIDLLVFTLFTILHGFAVAAAFEGNGLAGIRDALAGGSRTHEAAFTLTTGAAASVGPTRFVCAVRCTARTLEAGCTRFAGVACSTTSGAATGFHAVASGGAVRSDAGVGATGIG